MVIIERKRNAQIQVFLQTYGHVNISRQGSRLRMERPFMFIHRQHAAAGLGPGIERDIATRSDFDTALAQRVGIMLMYTGRSA